MRNFTLKMLPGIILGVLFTISGFVKVVDPMGLSYKVEEYLVMLQLSGLSGLSIPIAILLSASELLLGLLLLLRLWRKITAVVVILFMLGFTILTYLIYTDPYGGITECGCFGEALPLSNKVTFLKNIFFFIVAGLHLWFVFRQRQKKSGSFCYRRLGLVVGIFLVSFAVPLYAYFYLPPFDFLPYNVGTTVESKDRLRFYNSDFEDVAESVFINGKPTYMIGIKEDITPQEVHKLAPLYEAYKSGIINLFAVAPQNDVVIPEYSDMPVYLIDNVALKSVLRAPVGVIAFAGRQIVGKWNLTYTSYRFVGSYGDELFLDRLKRGVFLGGLLLVVVALFFGRKKMEA